VAVLEICTPIDQKKNNYQRFYWGFLKISSSEILSLLFTNYHALHWVLHSCISSCSYAFQCLLTPSSGNFSQTMVPAQRIKCLCILVGCLLKIVVIPQIQHFLYHESFSVKMCNYKLLTFYKFHVLAENLWWYKKWCIYEKTTIFNSQPTNTHKHLMCCEGTIVWLKLPEGGGNRPKTHSNKN
jgi:hypothetical protein